MAQPPGKGAGMPDELLDQVEEELLDEKERTYEEFPIMRLITRSRKHS